MNIVLIEDNEGDVFLFEESLTDLDDSLKLLKVLMDGEEALRYLTDPQSPNPDIIFLDINLPKLNGHDILDKIHDFLFTNKIPVVILSSSSNARDLKLKKLPCVVKYLLKPIEPLKLSTTIELCTKRKDF